MCWIANLYWRDMQTELLAREIKFWPQDCTFELIEKCLNSFIQTHLNSMKGGFSDQTKAWSGSQDS
jgi:hypothetical protein